jgi:hypothetical protein
MLPRVTPLPDERRLDACSGNLEKDVMELKAKLEELEAALKTETKATIAQPRRRTARWRRELPESASSCCYRSIWSGLCSPEEGAAGYDRLANSA